jgi:Tol biopolymer transport system component
LADAGFNRMIQLSPDGKKVLMGRSSPETQMEDLWIFQIDPGAWTRFTFNPLPAAEARWAPDSKQVVYFARPHGTFGLYRKAGDGSGTEETLFQQDHWLAARSIMPDSRYLIYETIDPESGVDLWLLPLFGDRKPAPFIQSSFGEGNASFSPDGRWVAYASDKSGQFEVYVRPFAGPGPESQISSGAEVSLSGGSPIAVHWRRDGKELFYLSKDGKVMSAAVTAGPAFQASAARALFAVAPGSQVEPSGDGHRFLVNAPVEDSKAAPLEVILNWTLGPAAK